MTLRTTDRLTRNTPKPDWSAGGPTLRRHIGLENVDDLKADLERGFAALKAAA
jgi:cystathionine beta-lyase/cystathionine gamma-synthase